VTICFPVQKTAIENPKTVFEDIYNVALERIRQRGLVERSDLIGIIRMQQKYEMDCHIVIAGQNGVGKTYLLLMMMREYLDAPFLPNLLLAKDDYDKFVQFILTEENTLLGVDELNQYLDYKKHAETEQGHLIRQLELARSNRIGIIGCVRDPRKLTLNYRQGKMSIVIWILDRFTYGGSYAAVFIGNPSIESYDKFGFSMIAENLIDMPVVREVFETLPSFIGYMRIPDISGIVPKEEIEHYKREKQMAMAYAHVKELHAQYRKRKKTYEECVAAIRLLQGKFGEEETERLVAAIPKRRSVKADETD
jgi:GTPase SAR1 family protein